MSQVLIISPDPDLVGRLRQSFSCVETLGQAAILRDYPTLAQISPLLNARRPAAIVVGLSQPEVGLALIRQLRRGFPGIVVAAAHTVDSSPSILEALRAGASEYLGPPFEAGYIQRGLERRWPLQATERRQRLGLADA